MKENIGNIRYEPLKNVIEALFNDDDTATTQELKEDLQKRGYNTDSIIARGNAIVKNAIQKKKRGNLP